MAIAFDLEEAFQILERTAPTLDTWLRPLPDRWLHADEGPETWSAFDILGHLIHGEKTDWIPRLRHIREHGEDPPFEPFDRFAQEKASRGKNVPDLLDEFSRLRAGRLRELRTIPLDKEALDARGTHPELGSVTARELLACWVAHDLAHLRQIGRVLARQYSDEVGPWRAFMPVMEE